MSEKVTIPKDIAADIEAIRSKGPYADRYLLSLAFKFTFGEEGRTLHDYASENYDTYVNAIVNGYTVEQSPEEKLRERYDHIRNAGRKDEYADGKADGFLETLNTLGLSIEGINA